LVVNKPAGINTHAPGPYAGEGLYDWVRHREPRWAGLGIIQRLDKETSGVLVFAKTAVANRSLTEQFTHHSVHKTYVLLTDRHVRRKDLTVMSVLARSGERYASSSARTSGLQAETRFKLLEPQAVAGGQRLEVKAQAAGKEISVVEAVPVTGRTHQIRVHAAENGFPILGDVLYGGTPAARVFLHASQITLKHPGCRQQMTFSAPVDFESDPRFVLRDAFIEPELTNAYRVWHGASDGRPGWRVDKLGDYLLLQSDGPLSASQLGELSKLRKSFSARGVYLNSLSREERKGNRADASPRLVLGEAAPERFAVRENGLQFELSLAEGYSVGLFLDQRDNRRRLLTGHIAADFPATPGVQRTVLNAFAYTCGFSVCTAKAGIRTTSVDLSRKYLEWGKRNFALNQLDPSGHDFFYGDAFDWLRRFSKKGRSFDIVLLDPPTFSQSKQFGVFRAEQDYGRLVVAALPLLKPGGILFASTNAAGWPALEFLHAVEGPVRAAKRRILRRHYAPQPPDFPISRAEPAYLKTVWLRLGQSE